MQIELTERQLSHLQALTAMKLQGKFIPFHTAALAAICKTENCSTFVKELASVWLWFFF